MQHQWEWVSKVIKKCSLRVWCSPSGVEEFFNNAGRQNTHVIEEVLLTCVDYQSKLILLIGCGAICEHACHFDNKHNFRTFETCGLHPRLKEVLLHVINLIWRICAVVLCWKLEFSQSIIQNTLTDTLTECRLMRALAGACSVWYVVWLMRDLAGAWSGWCVV
jgi:hypothetical protein